MLDLWVNNKYFMITIEYSGNTGAFRESRIRERETRSRRSMDVWNFYPVRSSKRARIDS